MGAGGELTTERDERSSCAMAIRKRRVAFPSSSVSEKEA
jgi:hypothetical protein